MDIMRYREIYQRTIEKWGEEAQCDQAVEECAELIATLKHYRRDKVDSQAVVDEIADVFLMVGQLIYMFDEEKVSDAVQSKLAKLQHLIDSKDGQG